MESSFIIQKAEERHLKQIADNICKGAYETEKYEANPEIILKSMEQIFQDRSYGVLYVALDNDKVVASLIETSEFNFIRNGMIYWIQSLYVLPEHRRKGISTKMIKHIFNEAKNEGVLPVKLYVANTNTVGMKVYERLEMTPVEEVFYTMNLLERDVPQFKALLADFLKETALTLEKLSKEELKTLNFDGCKSILNDYSNYESVKPGAEASFGAGPACELWVLKNEKKEDVGMLSAYLEVDDWNNDVMYCVSEILVFGESDGESLLTLAKTILVLYFSEAIKRNPSELRVKFNRNKANLITLMEELTLSRMGYLFYEESTK